MTKMSFQTLELYDGNDCDLKTHNGHLPFSLPLLKTVTSFKLTPRPLLIVTMSLVSLFSPRRIEPLE